MEANVLFGLTCPAAWYSVTANLISAGTATNQVVKALFHILKLILVPNVPINSARVVLILFSFQNVRI